VEEVKVHEAERFVFQPPPQIALARRVLLKPYAPHPQPHPATTSRETLEAIIKGIRRVSKADIIILEGNPDGRAMPPIYQALGYDFPRVLLLDVKDSLLVEIDNPLSKSLALPSAWVPNVLLSCDYWVSIAPFQVVNGEGRFTIPNLLGLLPHHKYRQEELQALGMAKVFADLYFILPFDLGIIEARQKFITADDPLHGRVEPCGKIFVGEPYEVDREASEALGVKTEYLDLIREAKIGFEF
jgi:hypothetical protein